MPVKHSYPGSFPGTYDREQAAAIEAGVCPHIVMRQQRATACGGKRVEGTQFCWRHQR